MSPPPPQEVPRATVAGAVTSLTKWMRVRAAEAPPNLLTDERDDLVLLQLSLRRVPTSPTPKPHLLPLPHPVFAHASASICVISDDRPNSRSPSASDLLDASKSLHLPISEVIPLSTLRTDYRPYESRRRLAASHDLFLADRAVLPLLPRVLGKAFYSTKKAPISVHFTRAGWPEQVRKVLSSTFLYLRLGTCSGIKAGRLDMEEEEIVENVMAVVEAAVEKVPKKWANVRALHLKAVDSVALPIYQVVPELGMKIEVPVGRLEGEVGDGEAIDAAEVETGGKRKNKNPNRTQEPRRVSVNWLWDIFMAHHLYQFLLFLSRFLSPLQFFLSYYLCWLAGPRTIRVDESYSIFNLDCRYRQYTTEWAIPYEHARVCLQEFRNWLDQERADAKGIRPHVPVEIRFSAPDDIWLSPSNGRTTCWIGIIQFKPYGLTVPYRRYFSGYEQIAARYQGRPHWAKAHELRPDTLRKLYPHFDDFLDVIQLVDPNGMFRNEYIQRHFYGKPISSRVFKHHVN